MQDFYIPKIGDVAPNFTVPSTRGNEVTMKEFRGKDVVLFFYPRGDESEAAAVRDRESDLSRAGGVVLAVSTEPLDRQTQLRDKYKLNFPLLSDETADLAKMYGVWGEKNVEGRRTWDVMHAAFWIGADGRIKRIYKSPDAVQRIAADMAAKK